MPAPNLKQHSDSAFLPRDMRCLGFDTQKNCYVFLKRNEIWLGIFNARWDGARLVRLGRVQQSALDEGVLDDLPATPEYPPDYAEESPTDPAENRRSVASTASSASTAWIPATPIKSVGETSVETVSGSPGAESADLLTEWGVPGVSITTSGAPPPDNENHLRKRASQIISAIRLPHSHIFHFHQRNDRLHDDHATASGERHRNPRASV